METPIVDFVRRYAKNGALRMHMPGHKGQGPLGIEQADITEIKGADSLYEADGIIRQSEQNAAKIFGTQGTFYSTEGSSLCIRAMLHLACLHAKKEGKKPLIYTGRNAHKTFLSAAALLDFDVKWLYPKEEESYLSCTVMPEELEKELQNAVRKPTAVYITSPDYLGNRADIGGLAAVCRRHGALLLVDNAHGAYLKFLPASHPMDLGADMCCDSAHKTLPVLTGGAYLHIGKTAPGWFCGQAKNAMALFGSTSPSYLILQSLDAANRYMVYRLDEKVAKFAKKAEKIKENLQKNGYVCIGNEPLKLTLATKSYGYTGAELAEILRRQNIECEFADPDFTVFMLTPALGEEALSMLEKALLSVPKKPEICEKPPCLKRAEQVLSVRGAAFSEQEIVSAAAAEGRILAAATVGCPPAVPIVVCGERIDASAVRNFAYYGIKTCAVVKE